MNIFQAFLTIIPYYRNITIIRFKKLESSNMAPLSSISPEVFKGFRLSRELLGKAIDYLSARRQWVLIPLLPLPPFVSRTKKLDCL
jgi:hypothetical protein